MPDQPDMNYQRWNASTTRSKTIDDIPLDIQACRPEMWQGGNETEKYLLAMGQPGNLDLLDHPPCSFAHINPFKFPWLSARKVDAFCSVRGFGHTSRIFQRVMEVSFNNTFGLGISSKTASWCVTQVRGTRRKHDTNPHHIDG